MTTKPNSAMLTWLKSRLPARPWTPPPTADADLDRLNEMPRFPLRVALLAFLVLTLGFLLFVFYEVGNPLAGVRDGRRGVSYNRQPLTSLATGRSSPTIWLGSAGGGLKVYDGQYHYFRKDITAESSGGALGGNFIRDLAVQTNLHPLAAIALAESEKGPAGVQVGSFGFAPEFWTRPVVGMRSFDGITDTNASCVAVTADQSHLLIGSRGFGLGIYDVSSRSWTGTVTTHDGLPSDVVNDLVVKSDGNGCVVWIGTSGGLCGGSLNGAGQFAKEWSYTPDSGLAGRGIKRLLLKGTNLWYVTDGGGLGRIILQSSGVPVNGASAQALVTERNIPGLQEAGLGWVRGGSRSHDAWFTGNTPTGERVGRHREHPYDTAGVELPAGLRLDAISCAASDPGSAPVYLLGTDHGAFFFATPAVSNANPIVPIVAGQAGLGDLRIQEAAISGDLAVVKHRAAGGVAGLQTAVVRSASNWVWRPLVGTNRFMGFQDQDPVTCATTDGRRVFFGTEGKGIGVWDRTGAELRLEYHSRYKGGTKLRSDNSLDLAWADGALVQVTGDHAVEALTNLERLTIVPPEGMPFAVADIVATDALGSWLVCASARRAAQYDMRSFRWTELPPLAGIQRVALSRERIWAVTAVGNLFHIALGGADRKWTESLAEVKDWAVHGDSVRVLSQTGRQVGLYSFDPIDGKKISSIVPIPRAGGPPRWEFAALQDQKLWLVGDRPCVEIYDPQTRAWGAKDFPAAVQPPIVTARRSAGTWWFLDRARTLHAFKFADQSFQVDLQKGIEQLDTAGTDAVAVLAEAPDAVKLVRFREDGRSEALVGAGFGGDLSRLADLVEESGGLIAAQGSWIGRYAWREHGWKSFRTSVDSITRFHQAGRAVWVEARNQRGTSPYFLGSNALAPVLLDDVPVTGSILRADANRLLVLSGSGAVLEVAPQKPKEARALLAAEKMPGNLPTDPQLIASLNGWLAVADGRRIHFYGSDGGPAGWKTVDVEESVLRLCTSPSDHQLMAITASSIRLVNSPGKVSQGLKVSQNASARIVGASLNDSSVLGAIQMTGETGARIWTVADAGGGHEIIGAPLPPSASTKAVLEPVTGQLLRLDTTGGVGLYEEKARAWKVEPTPAPLTEMWLMGRTVVGWSRQAKSLFQRQPGGDWTPTGTFDRRVEGVQSFPAGLVLQLTGGALAWQNERGGFIVREARTARGFPAGFGTVVAAVESSNVLHLLDQAGRLALFDWARQSWCGFKGGPVRRLVSGQGGVFVLLEQDGQQVLSGPVAFTPNGAESRPVPSSAGLTSLTSLGGQLYFISADGALFRATSGFSQRLWSGPDAPAVTAKPVLQAALRVGSEFWLIVAVREGQSAMLRVQPRSLASSATLLPPGRVEKIMALGPGELCASLVATNGRFPFSLTRAARLAEPQPDVAEILVRDHQLIALTGANTVPFDLSRGTGWRRDLAQPALTGEERSGLLVAAEAELDRLATVPTSHGWKDPATLDGFRAVAITNSEVPGQTANYLLPAADRLALAHERATGLATDGVRLFVATPGGVLEFDPASPQMPIALHNQNADGPIALPSSLEWAGSLQCRTTAGLWRLQGRTWVPGQPFTDADRALVTNDAANLKNWRRIPGQAQTWQRRFSADRWRTVELTPYGFNFEQVVAAEVRDNTLLTYTPAGTLVFQPGETIPGDLLPTWAAPVGLREGTVTSLDAQTSVLSPTGSAPNPLWVRGTEAWEPAGKEPREALSRRATRPYLDTRDYLWERAPAGTTNDPVTVRSGTTSLAGFFRPKIGRFDWETCLQLGQAHGEPWVLTRSGLLRLGPQGLDLSEPVRLQEPLEELSFVATSGDQPGALKRGGRVEWVFDQVWKPAARTSQDAIAQLSSHSHLSPTWRIERGGTIERALPQSPGTFAAVRLQPDRRWDFEAVTDLVGNGDDVTLATVFGVSVLDDHGRVKELWPMAGIREVGLVDGTWQAESGEGRHQLKAGKWSRISGSPPLHPPSAMTEGAWLSIERRFPGVTLQFRPRAGAPFRPFVPGPRRFPFDELGDAAIVPAGSVACVTKAGLAILGANGDLALEQIAAAKFGDGRFFCRVPELENESTLHICDTSGSTWTFQQGWQPSPQRTADALLALSRRRLVLGQQWRVSKPTPSTTEFELHFAGESPDVRHKITLAPDHTGFAVDRFTSVAEQSGDNIILGSQGGLQRVGPEGAIQRIWGDSGGSVGDGLPLEATDSLISDRLGAVQILAAGKHYALAATGDAIRPSNREAFNRARSERHFDPDGWNVELNPAQNPSLSLHWKGEQAFLVDQPNGSARFAHNVVNAALQTTAGLWLATEGGLVVVPAASPAAVAGMKLVVTPFLSANAAGQAGPVSLKWLGHSTTRGDALVDVGGPRGGRWKGPASSPTTLAPATGAALDAEPIARDDLLVWSRPGPGRVQINYTPGWVFPGSARPHIQDGTFSFLDLDGLGRLPHPESLAATTNSFVWATRAGLVSLFGHSTNKWHLRAETDSRTPLTNVVSVTFDAGSDAVWAMHGDIPFRFDTATDSWVRGTRPAPIRLKTPRTIWSDGKAGRPRLAHTDAPTAPWLDGGKPAIDHVLDLALIPESGGDMVLVASMGGVVTYRADTFAHVGLQAAAFQSDPKALGPVTELAWWPGEGGTPPRLCARSNGRGFERDKRKWSGHTNVDGAFELSYRRVRQTNQWHWSRHPAGLSVELPNVNGEAVWLGRALDGSRLPLFSRGRISLDDVRCVTFAGPQLLLGSAVGIVRLDLDAAAGRARFAGLDLWVTHPNRKNHSQSLTNLSGLYFEGGLLAWNDDRTFTNGLASKRAWTGLDLSPKDLFSSRTLAASQGRWEIGKNDPRELWVRFQHRGGGRTFYVPVEDGNLRHVSYSPQGLWILSGNRLYHCDQEREERAN